MSSTNTKRRMFPSWILSPNPNEVAEHKHTQKAVVGGIVVAAIVGVMIFKNNDAAPTLESIDPMPVDTYYAVPESGCSIPPVEPCNCYMSMPIPADEFVERALASARKHGASDADIAWMRGRWKIESWNNPVAIGQDGDIGLCQIHWASHKDVDPVKLMTNPEYAGEICFGIVRDNRVCGEWQHCCYRRGICGCQLWLKEEKGISVNWRSESDCKGRVTAINKEIKR